MKILITGANGMLAQSIKKRFALENELLLTDANELDITAFPTVQKYIAAHQPDLIINCAAYTAVDQAEQQPELAKKINADGPKNLAIAAQKNTSVLVHISTDYVFGGDKPITETYSEDDHKSPRSVYGKTKLTGEDNVIKNCDKYYIVRTAWLYGEGKNFVRTMLGRATDKRNINTMPIVNDQYGSPTYADDLADIIVQVINKQLPYGIYHATNQGFTTWYNFAKKIFELAKIQCQIIPISSAEYPAPAERPKNSQLSKDKLLQYGITIPTWEDALERYLIKELKK